MQQPFCEFKPFFVFPSLHAFFAGGGILVGLFGGEKLPNLSKLPILSAKCEHGQDAERPSPDGNADGRENVHTNTTHEVSFGPDAGGISGGGFQPV